MLFSILCRKIRPAIAKCSFADGLGMACKLRRAWFRPLSVIKVDRFPFPNALKAIKYKVILLKLNAFFHLLTKAC